MFLRNHNHVEKNPAIEPHIKLVNSNPHLKIIAFPLRHWNRGFKSRSRHGRFCPRLSVLCHRVWAERGPRSLVKCVNSSRNTPYFRRPRLLKDLRATEEYYKFIIMEFSPVSCNFLSLSLSLSRRHTYSPPKFVTKSSTICIPKLFLYRLF